MKLFAGISVLFMTTTAAIVGLRLLLLWKNTRQLPELLLGLNLLLMLGVGYSLFIALRAAGDVSPALASALYLSGLASVVTGLLMQALFTWRVFRPQSKWAAAFSVAIGGVVIVGVMQTVWNVTGSSKGPEALLESTPSSTLLLTGPAVVVYLWSAVEALGYYKKMRRRMRLGLSEPDLCNRFLLWGIVGLAAALGGTINGVSSLSGVDILTNPWVMSGSSLAGIGQSGALLFAFCAPRWYLDWISARSAVTEAPA